MAAFAGPILDYLGRMPILPLTLVVAASLSPLARATKRSTLR
jgi:hypothetical protein